MHVLWQLWWNKSYFVFVLFSGVEHFWIPSQSSERFVCISLFYSTMQILIWKSVKNDCFVRSCWPQKTYFWWGWGSQISCFWWEWLQNTCCYQKCIVTGFIGPYKDHWIKVFSLLYHIVSGMCGSFHWRTMCRSQNQSCSVWPVYMVNCHMLELCTWHSSVFFDFWFLVYHVQSFKLTRPAVWGVCVCVIMLVHFLIWGVC